MAEESANTVRDVAAQFQTFFDSLTFAKKAVLFSVIAVVLLGLAALIYVANREAWTPLYSNISTEDAALVKEALDNAQIPVLIGPGGRSLLVPSDRVDEARLALASERITLGGGLGFAELFVGQTGIGETEFQQHVKFRMALEGELGRLISRIRGVRSAKVTLALPKKSLFIEEEEKPTASVVMDLAPSISFTRGQVLTVAHLVANSVEGMVKENVVVVDQTGKLLSRSLQRDDAGGSFEDQFAFRRAFEQRLEAKIIAQLEPVVGEGRVKPSVSVEMSFDKITTNEEIFDPDATVVRSEQISTEQSTGTRSIPVGIPGVLSNLPETQAGASEVANVSQISKTNEVRNFETSVKRVVTEPAMGRIEHLNVSVLIDGKYKPITDPDTGRILTTQWEEWTTEEKKEIERLVRAAVGFNEKRGDTLEVVNIRFIQALEQDVSRQIERTQRNRQFFLDILRYTFLGVLLLAMILFVIRPMVQRLSQTPEDLDLLMGLPATIGELEGEELEIPTEREVGLPPRDRILEIARSDPLATASLVRSWLREKR
ncbi:MAG: flagellar M-ring protein FliF [SAR324 cluster bacterium]|nr:flagellar M-ring protein FliF [SAR324 cluster bacterium]